MKKSGKSKYVNLPLSFLAYGKTWQERADVALGYGIVDTALNSRFIASTIPEDEDESMVIVDSQYFDEDAWPKDADEDDEEHRRIVFTALRLGIRFPSISRVRKEHAELKKFVEAYEERHGADARTKVHIGVLFALRDGKGWPQEEFTVFAAVNSTFGKHPVRKLAQNAIRMRALGYKSGQAYAAEFGKRTDGMLPLPNHKITRLTDKLVRQGLIKKMSLNRATYYGQAHLTDAAFAQLVTELETRTVTAAKRGREIAGQVAAAIRKSKEDAKRLRVARRQQSDLFDGAAPPIAFHRVDDLREQYSPEDYRTMLNAQNAKKFKVDGVEYIAVSTLPVNELRRLCRQAHGGANGAPIGTPKGESWQALDTYVF